MVIFLWLVFVLLVLLGVCEVGWGVTLRFLISSYHVDYFTFRFHFNIYTIQWRMLTDWLTEKCLEHTCTFCFAHAKQKVQACSKHSSFSQSEREREREREIKREKERERVWERGREREKRERSEKEGEGERHVEYSCFIFNF